MQSLAWGISKAKSTCCSQVKAVGPPERRVCGGWATSGGGQAGHVNVVLDAKGHAEQRKVGKFGKARFELPGALHRRFSRNEGDPHCVVSVGSDAVINGIDDVGGF